MRFHETETNPSFDNFEQPDSCCYDDLVEKFEQPQEKTSRPLGPKTSALIVDKLEAMEKSLDRLEETAIESARATDKIIRHHPYQTMGIAAALGIFIGILLFRK